MASGKKKKINKNGTQDLFSDVDEKFAFIAGYTAGGFPFGTTWDEMEASDVVYDNHTSKCDKNNSMGELPFD